MQKSSSQFLSIKLSISVLTWGWLFGNILLLCIFKIVCCLWISLGESVFRRVIYRLYSLKASLSEFFSVLSSFKFYLWSILIKHFEREIMRTFWKGKAVELYSINSLQTTIKLHANTGLNYNFTNLAGCLCLCTPWHCTLYTCTPGTAGTSGPVLRPTPGSNIWSDLKLYDKL